jgi:hypothetical protein
MSKNKPQKPAPDKKKGDDIPKKGPLDPSDGDQNPGPSKQTPDAPNPEEHPGGTRG